MLALFEMYYETQRALMLARLNLLAFWRSGA